MKPVTLKIKIKTLAAEAGIIRHEEQKALNQARWASGVAHRNMIKFCNHVARRDEFTEHDKQFAEAFALEAEQSLAGLTANDALRAPGQYARYTQLRNHRVNQVRKEARASQLAYAFLRGLSYITAEKDAKRPLYDWEIEAVIRNVKAHRVGVYPTQTLPDLKTAITDWLHGSDSPFAKVSDSDKEAA